MAWLALIFASCFAVPALVLGETIKRGSAYSGVTIAIHKDVPQNSELLDNLKNEFTAASSLLYEATGGWAYFKDIVIAVPETWKAIPAGSVYSDPYPKAEFRIEKANGAYGDSPYTLQTGGCGEPGEYVHLTPEFVLKGDSFINEVYGPRDRLLVHEWSHLRYGVFDEYGTAGDKTFPLFYFDDGLMKVNLCSEEIKGWVESSTGPICDVYEDDVSRDCTFVPDTADTSVRNSIMSVHYLPNVNRFCTKDNATGTVHNWQAPNKQNLLCQRRSAWEVISSHPDFTVQKPSGEKFTPPTFQVVRLEKVPPRFVFVLDVSGSMAGQPLELMKRSTNWFVNDLVKAESMVGAVTFHSDARLLQPVVKVNEGTRRSITANLQSMQANGGTSIGAGITAAINALKSAGQRTEDAVLIVISDGEENSAPIIRDVIPTIKATKVKILAVAFGRSASKDLEEAATVSGGKSVLIQNIQGTSTADIDQMFITATTIQADSEVQLVQLLNKPFQLTGAVTQTTVTLDAELGKNVVFSLGGQVDQVDMDLESPTGKHYVTSSSEFSRSPGRVQYKLAIAESGKWIVNIRKKAGGAVTVDLTLVSEPRNEKIKPITVEAKLGNEKPSAAKGVKVIARVTKDSDIVIRAEVEALVLSDIGTKNYIKLNDNGSGADMIKDDGVYTGVFTQFDTNAKRYTVTAQITNRGKAFIKSAKYSPAPVMLPRKTRVPPKTPPSNRFKLSEFQKLDEDPYADEPVGEKADDFDRTTNGGSFIVDDVEKAVTDRIKPSPVSDLAVVETGENKKGQKFISLTWTAPGDNMDVGTPAKLEIRMSVNGNGFVKEFSTGHLIGDGDVLSGDLKPKAGGEKHEVTLALPKEILDVVPKDKPFDVYVAVKATDKAGNVGDLGRIAAGHFGYEIPVCVQPTGMFPRARRCNEFYHCSNGIAYLKNCPANLHYSRQSMRCEWPCSAKCDPTISCAPNS